MADWAILAGDNVGSLTDSRRGPRRHHALQPVCPLPPPARPSRFPSVLWSSGPAAATGAYALIDDEQVVQAPFKVIVRDAPAPAGVGTTAKDEAGTAAAIGTR